MVPQKYFIFLHEAWDAKLGAYEPKLGCATVAPMEAALEAFGPALLSNNMVCPQILEHAKKFAIEGGDIRPATVEVQGSINYGSFEADPKRKAQAFKASMRLMANASAGDSSSPSEALARKASRSLCEAIGARAFVMEGPGRLSAHDFALLACGAGRSLYEAEQLRTSISAEAGQKAKPRSI